MAEKIGATIVDIPINKVGNFVGGGTSPRPAEMTDAEKFASSSTKDAERARVAMVDERFNSAKSIVDNQIIKWDIFYKLYRGYVAEKDKQWVSNLFVPVAFTVIETLLPRIMSVMFGPKFVVKINPREKGDAKMVRVLQQLLKYQFDRFGAFNKFYRWVKDTLMYGVGYVVVYWKFEATERTVVEPKYFNLAGVKIRYGRQQVKRPIVDYDDPEVEVVDPYDLFVDPRATNIKDAKWVIRRVWRTMGYLRKQQAAGFYKNIDDVKPGLTNTGDMDKSVRVEVGGGQALASTDDRDLVELREHWEDGSVTVVAGGAVEIRHDENPFWHGNKPICMLKDIELPHEFYAIGEIEPIQSLIEERNTIRNQRLDNVKTIVNRKLVVNKNADIDIEHLDEDNRPGGIILTDDVNAVRYLDEIDIVASAFNEDQMIVRDIQEATAMAESTIGVMPRRGETATAINALQGAASSRFALKIQGMVSTGIMDCIKMIISLNQQFLTKKRLVRIIGEAGEDFQAIAAEDITGNYDYDIQAGLLEINRDIERQQWMMLLGTPVMQAANINFEEVQKYTLELFDVSNPERFIKEMTPEMQMAMASAGAPGTPGQPSTPSGTGIPSIKGVPGTPAPQV